ncbi:4-hydroxy-3-methylbut-2-enyl diphosphate reductase [Eubacterium plexicaudatum ASF492]|nr:4-hydroxy-3-methylbut-2-enyl diphosphate reductase [Eubacterium plexicaudatum ASF492]
MNITVAKSAGFCFGVKRAVNKVYEQADIKDGPIYTYGPIIHNEEVVKDLKEKGVTVLDDLETLTEEQRKKGGTVIIRSHGVSKEIYQRLEQAGFEIEDATCPFVLKIHQIVEEFSNDGYEIVIIGSARHPEVEGIRGWCDPEFTTVIADQEEAENFEPKSGKKCVLWHKRLLITRNFKN